jgi:hypothetical protein
MTITELIQDVAGDIAVQRTAMDSLKEKRVSLMAAFLVSMTMLMVNILLASPTLLYTIPMLILTIVSGFQLNWVNNEAAQIQTLLVQNVSYRNLIIEEAYAGKSCDP